MSDGVSHINQLTEIVRTSNEKETHIEKRSMNWHMLPHEGVRQLHSILGCSRPDGDTHWALRQISGVILVYFRVLSVKYHNMLYIDKAWMVRILLIEACKRRVEEVGHDAFETQKYHQHQQQQQQQQLVLLHCAYL